MFDTLFNTFNFLNLLYLLGASLVGYIMWSELYLSEPSNYKNFTYKELELKILKELGTDALYAIEKRRVTRGINDVEALVPIIVEYIYTHHHEHFKELIELFSFQEELPLKIQISLRENNFSI